MARSSWSWSLTRHFGVVSYVSKSKQMQVDWRSLLSSIRVAWIDKGRNVSKGNINVKCPFCYDDPSFHMSIAETREAYFCYREPNRHSGRSFVRLLVKLGQTRDEALKLLNYHRDRSADGRAPIVSPVLSDLDQIGRGWARFAPASGNDDMLRYLQGRGFASPRSICDQYDLRYANAGEWARRLLLPLKENAQVIGWTGRSIVSHIQPNYLSRMTAGQPVIFAADGDKPKANHLLIVEGPLDALKVSAATKRLPIKTAALNGKYLGPAKMMQLRRLAKDCDKVWLALDNDVAISSVYQTINELSGVMGSKRVSRLKLPQDRKDPGELSIEETVTWLASL